MKSPRLWAALSVLLVTLIWSVSTLLFKSGLRSVPPLTFTAAQITIAALVLGGLALARGELRGQWSGPNALPRADWARLVAMGLSRYVLGQATFILSLARLSASSSTFVSSFNNLAVMLLAIIFLGERPSLRQAAGGLLAIFGAYLFFSERLTIGQDWGIIFGAVNVLAFSGYNVLARGVGRQGQASNLLVTAVSLAVGAPFLVLLAWWLEGPFQPAVFSGIALVAVLWGGLMDTGLSLSLWNRALRVLWPYEVTVLARTQMIEVPLFERWLFGEAISSRKWLAIGVTLVGILFSQRWEAPKRPQVENSGGNG